MKKYKEQVSENFEMLKAKADAEKEAKQISKVIKMLKSTTSTNKDARAEFAKNIFQLSLSSDPLAKTFIKKVMKFCTFFGEDMYLDEDEWRKLNNTDKLDEED